jgi:hypothetical protein
LLVVPMEFLTFFDVQCVHAIVRLKLTSLFQMHSLTASMHLRAISCSEM